MMMTICLTPCLGSGAVDAQAQGKAKEPPKRGRSNSADLSLVLTAVNSAPQTWGVTDQLRHVWMDARFEFGVDLVRSKHVR
jgi:hypothetical protein